jgi:hypothetical protein
MQREGKERKREMKGREKRREKGREKDGVENKKVIESQESKGSQ